jgi:hypothetical protein
MIQLVFCMSIGLSSAYLIYRVARRGLLNFRYTVGWLSLSAFGMMAGIVIPVITPITNLLAITSAALLANGGIILLVAICVQLSISISGLHERQRRLTEELAHLRQTIDFVIQQPWKKTFNTLQFHKIL